MPSWLTASAVTPGAMAEIKAVSAWPGGDSIAQVTPSSVISRTPSYQWTGCATELVRSSMTASAVRALLAAALVTYRAVGVRRGNVDR